jgi:hypothetical protein
MYLKSAFFDETLAICAFGVATGGIIGDEAV